MAACAAAVGGLGLLPGTALAQPRAVIAFLPAIERAPLPDNASQEQKDARKALFERESTLNQLAQRPQLALGFDGATQGAYSRVQALLDLTQGTRVSKAAYKPPAPPELGFVVSGGAGRILDWALAASRAEKAPADTIPGLLAGSIPGGAGYVGISGQGQPWAIAAADRRGRIAEVSLGTGRSVGERVQRVLANRRLVVASLAAGPLGARALDEILAGRARDELVIAVKAPPDRFSPQLLPMGIAGLNEANGGLTSDTTRRQYIIAGIDVLPTVLEHLGIAVPDKVIGQAIRVQGDRDVDAMRAIEGRLRVINGRRIPALKIFLEAWLALLIALRLAAGRPGMRFANRVGALGLLWVPSVLLVTAALAPSRNVEFAIVTVGCLSLGALTDALLPWPRGPLLPALVGLAAYTIDLANDSTLIVQSLLGPNPRFGSRYYGLGNELEASLPILMLFGLAAVMTLRDGPGRELRTRRGAITFAGCGLVLGIVMASGRLGADVGAVFTVGAAAAGATLLMLPGGITRRALALAIAVPALGLAALAALDLATGGNSHFTRSILHDHGGGHLFDTVTRRYRLAFSQFKRGLMPFLTVLSIGFAVLGVRRRVELFVALRGSPPWEAAFGGALAASVAGALFNDSGPLLFVFGMVIIAFMTLYARAVPAARAAETEQESARPPRSALAPANTR